MHSCNELVKANYKAYQQGDKKERGEILDRLVKDGAGNRDYLAWKLGHFTKAQSEAKKSKQVRKKRAEGHRGGRPPKYTGEFVKVLVAIWLDHGQICGKLLVPTIRGMIGFLCESKAPDYGITSEIRAMLLSVSPAGADNLLKPAREAQRVRGISTTRSVQTPLRSQIPVQTHFDRDKVKPGDFAFDTVAHCGASATGQFCKTLTGTSPYSGWIEERPLLNAANHWVKTAIEDVEAHLPFPMTGAHYDNGMEFINAPLLQWCLARHIRPTRSRPYKKNDNCFAEQKNYDAVRKSVGYFRFDTPDEYAALAKVYHYLCPLYNYWYHSSRLVAKEQGADGRYHKRYEKTPRTPYERLMDSPDISDECKDELRRRKEAQNPVELNNRLNKAVERLLKINREKGNLGTMKKTISVFTGDVFQALAA